MGMNDYGIDLGTANTLVYRKSKGIIVNEPSLIATDILSEKTIAVGNEAKAMLGRVPQTVSVDYTINDGVISAFDKTEQMLRLFMSEALSSWGNGNRIVMSIPCHSTPVDRRAVKDLGYTLKAKKVFLIEEPLAAALGSNLAVFEPCGRMVVDMGAGTTEIAGFYLGGVVFQYSLYNYGGNQMNQEIVNYIRTQYSILIGEPTAEALKVNLGGVLDTGTVEFMTVSGLNLNKRLPENLVVSSDDIRDAIMPTVKTIVEGIRYTLENIDPEISSDIIANGILLTGGVAMLPNWVDLIEKKLGVKSTLSDYPLESVAIGAGNAFDHMDLLRKYNSLQ